MFSELQSLKGAQNVEPGSAFKDQESESHYLQMGICCEA